MILETFFQDFEKLLSGDNTPVIEVRIETSGWDKKYSWFADDEILLILRTDHSETVQADAQRMFDTLQQLGYEESYREDYLVRWQKP